MWEQGAAQGSNEGGDKENRADEQRDPDGYPRFVVNGIEHRFGIGTDQGDYGTRKAGELAST